MEAGSADEELRIALQRVARRIRANRVNDLSDTQLSVLFALSKGDRSPGELAELEMVSPPSMNRTLNSLEEAALVERHPAEGDARKVRVTITKTGRKTVERTRRLRTEWFIRQLEQLDEREREILHAAIPILHRLAGQ